MKKSLSIAVFIFIALTFQNINSNAGALDGGVLHKQILSKYLTIDKFYFQPTLAGGGTTSPMVHIYLPLGEWGKLSPAQQNSLKTYAALATKYARANPLQYSNIPPTAPIANKIRENSRFITEKNWIIYSGSLTSNGRDILQEKAVARGK